MEGNDKLTPFDLNESDRKKSVSGRQRIKPRLSQTKNFRKPRLGEPRLVSFMTSPAAEITCGPPENHTLHPLRKVAIVMWHCGAGWMGLTLRPAAGLHSLPRGISSLEACEIFFPL
ncbi:hypothetical protein IC762_32975 [Bradyrhizobium genosp. L]|uniref:hypothetical protein n=1 Tax=Bradyrhizobium genosp. L TaxID=83637 RepID=UPI0018A28C72|nr:hypothetical protein [Bradyrhizobium genosp. L]QPF84370.1 hypothetical protein IC762_32975 [Bradyrhizobium genosp. L]